jgi:hypothetical protein
MSQGGAAPKPFRTSMRWENLRRGCRVTRARPASMLSRLRGAASPATPQVSLSRGRSGNTGLCQARGRSVPGDRGARHGGGRPWRGRKPRRATSLHRSNRRWMCNGLDPGSKALKSRRKRRLRPVTHPWIISLCEVSCGPMGRPPGAWRPRVAPSRRRWRTTGGHQGAERRHGSGRGEGSEG